MYFKKAVYLVLIIAASYRATAQTNQTLSNGGATTAVTFTGSSCTYNWVNNNASIGLAASGTGNIASFKAVNTGSSPITATITATPVGGFAYIADYDLDTVSVINTATNAVVATIPVGNGPLDVAVSPDGTRAYVTNYNDATVSVINTATNMVIATVVVGVGEKNNTKGDEPGAIVVSPDGSHVYVFNAYGSNPSGASFYVSVINTSTNTVANTVGVGIVSDGMAISPDGTKLYLTDINGGGVAVLNTSTFAVNESITVGNIPYGLAVSPDGSLLYVVNSNANAGTNSQGSVSVVNTATNAVIATISVSSKPAGVAVSPDGSRLYVTNEGDGTVSVINTATDAVVSTITGLGNAQGISVSPDNTEVYVTNNDGTANGSGVSVISVATDAVIKTIGGFFSAPNDIGNFMTAGPGCSAVTFTITVNPSPPTISYASPQTYVINSAITPLAPTSTAVAAPAYGSGPLIYASGFANGVYGVATDAKGDVYFAVPSGADPDNIGIYEIPSGGGTPVSISGSFASATGVAVDAAGNVYVADQAANAVYKIPVVGGSAISIGSGFSSPTGVAVDASGNVYVADAGNNAVKEILAGNLSMTTLGSGFSGPAGVSADAAGDVFVADAGNNAVKEIIAGNSTPVTVGSGFSGPSGVYVDAEGDVFISDTKNSALKEIPSGSGTVTTIATGFSGPLGVAADGGGNIYIADTGNDGIKEITPIGGYFINPALPGGLTFNNVTGVVSGAPSVLSTQSNYIVTAYSSFGSANAVLNLAISQNPPPGISYSGPNSYAINSPISPLAPANSGVSALAYGGPASIASGFNFPQGIAVDAAGNIYVADFDNNEVKKIPVGGGNPIILSSGFSTPTSVAVDALGNVYVADYGNNAVKEIPVGGNAFIIGSGFSNPYGVAVDAAGNVYVADNGNLAIKKIPVGSGSPVSIGSGFLNPLEVAVDASGNVYVADQGDNTVKEIESGNGSTITIGTGFNSPLGLTVDGTGNVFVADRSNNAIKEITAGGSAPATIISTLNLPSGVAVSRNGYIYVTSGNTVNKNAPIGGYFINNLPPGLIFNNSTGIISGTPTAVSPATNYTVTAYNGNGGSSATVNITISANPNLSALQLSSGTLSPAFASGSTSYTASVANTITSITVTPTTSDATATVKVNGTAVTSATASAAIPLKVGLNTITILVTAQDGVTTKTYTLSVTRAPSTNAYLLYLSAQTATLSPGFSYKTLTYTSLVPNSTTSVTVTPSLLDTTATVKVNSTPVANKKASGPIALVIGSNTITILVTAQDGVTTQTYTITITRPSTNDNLSALKISAGTLTPAFATGTSSYTASVGNAVTSLTVIPNTADPAATIKVNGIAVSPGTSSAAIALNVGSNTITTVVTAQDGVTKKNYTITVTRTPSNNAYLLYLSVQTATLSPGFAYRTFTYTTHVPNSTTSVTVTPSVLDLTATVKVNGTAVVNKTASGPIALAVGANTINIVVTAQDGVTTQTYTMTITRAPSANDNLSALKISAGTLTPAFATGTTSYTASVGNGIASIAVTPTASDPTATVKVNGTAVSSGTASGAIALNVGPNTITTVVTAQDGVTKKTYTVTVTREPSNNAYLLYLSIQTATLSPTFAYKTLSYTSNVHNTTSSVTVTPSVLDLTATVKVNGTAVANKTASGPIALAVGTNTITILVTAQDGTTTQTYTVTITRAVAGADGYAPIAIGTGLSVNNPVESPSFDDDIIAVHQGISPNGDGINDFLVIDGILAYPDNKLIIMNRNGQLIYEAQGYDNSSKVFDGHSDKNGQMQLPGTYFYQLDYTVGGVTKHKTGFIVLKY
jgi:gliding motility-associated-like protein